MEVLISVITLLIVIGLIIAIILDTSAIRKNTKQQVKQNEEIIELLKQLRSKLASGQHLSDEDKSRLYDDKHGR